VRVCVCVCQTSNSALRGACSTSILGHACCMAAATCEINAPVTQAAEKTLSNQATQKNLLSVWTRFDPNRQTLSWPFGLILLFSRSLLLLWTYSYQVAPTEPALHPTNLPYMSLEKIFFGGVNTSLGHTHQDYKHTLFSAVSRR
jgi:hypothetical protein